MRKEIEEKIKKIIEFHDSVLGKTVCKELTGVDGSVIKKYLKAVLNNENYNKETVLRNLIAYRNGLKRLGYRYKEIAEYTDDVIKYLQGVGDGEKGNI